MIKIILLIVGSALLIVLATVLIRFNVKRLHIIRSAKAATDDQLEAVYTQLENLGAEPPTCAILARTNRRSTNDCDWRIPIPAYITPATGSVGSAIVADGGKDVSFRFSSSMVSDPVLRGQFYRIVPVPRFATKTGKQRNQFSPARYLSNNPTLRAALSVICPKYPAELLSYLLAAGAETFEFEPMDQARLGGSPAWVQDPDFPTCPQCQKRMAMILQLPGSLLPGKKLPEGTFWFFCCATHLDQTKTVYQFA